MLYAFIALASVVLIALLCFTIFSARKNSGEYLMNMILLTRYNRLLSKMSKKGGFKRDDYMLQFQEKENFTENDVIANIKVIQYVDFNFSILKSMESNKSNDYDKLIPLMPLNKISKDLSLTESFEGKSKRVDIYKCFNLLSNIIIKKSLPSEISDLFGNAEGWQIENFLIFLFTSKAVIVDTNDVFNCQVVDYKDLTLTAEKLGVHEVEYDGKYPLEDLDFRQEEIVDDHAVSGYNLITKVKCSQYKLSLKYANNTLHTQVHLMKTSDMESFEKLMKIGE